MHALPFGFRQALRWILILLRSIPELVWALVFVRVVGLGPAAGVLAIGLTYAGMLGKVYSEILESGDAHATTTLLRNGGGRLQAFSLDCCRKMPLNSPATRSIDGSARFDPLRSWALWVQAGWASRWMLL